MIVHSRVRGILLLAINVTFVLLSYENGQKALTRPWTPLGAHPQTPDPRYRFALRVRHVPHFANPGSASDHNDQFLHKFGVKRNSTPVTTWYQYHVVTGVEFRFMPNFCRNCKFSATVRHKAARVVHVSSGRDAGGCGADGFNAGRSLVVVPLHVLFEERQPV